MTIILIFLAGVGAIAAWWLSQQGLASKPWLEQGVLGEDRERAPRPAAQVGLGVFLAVAGSLFALSFSAYAMRVEAPDWWPLPVPRLLWFNTSLLAMSSVALETARRAARRADTGLGPLPVVVSRRVHTRLLIAAALATAFLLGQAFAWRQLVAEGYGLASNPSSSFFYLMTGLHGLHVAGGLVALMRAVSHIGPNAQAGALRLATELCAVYWHFLLVIWLILLALLTGWASSLVALCQRILT